MNPDISIVIINYNNVDLTSDCIQSIYDKCKSESFEIILVDNASTAGNIDDVKTRFPDIILLKSDKNLGFAKGNNLGIARAKAETILLLNNDTVLINDAVSLAYKRLWENKDLGVITSQLLYPDGNIQPNAGSLPSLSRTIMALLRLDRLMPAKKRARLYLGFFFDHRSEVFAEWIWGAFYMIKRKVINKLPEQKMPDDLFMYGEDIEWGYAVRKTGYKTLFYPEAKVTHFVGQSNFSKTNSAIKTNMRYVIKKYKGAFYTNVFLFFYKLYNISLAVEYKITRRKFPNPAPAT